MSEYDYLTVIQARMGSSRLPGKVMKPLCGIPSIGHLLERLKRSQKCGKMIVATTLEPKDDVLCDYLKDAGVDFYRGSEKDVLQRFYEVSLLCPAQVMVRVTADNPLTDPLLLDEMIRLFEKSGCRYARLKGFPIGVGAEVFETSLLHEAWQNVQGDYEHEHVTPYMYTRQESMAEYTSEKDLSNIRLTMDTPEDYVRLQEIYTHLYKGRHDFYFKDILDYLDSKKAERQEEHA